MDLLADTWYRVGDIFDGRSQQLRDGSAVFTTTAALKGSRLELQTGWVWSRQLGVPYRYLQLSVVGVAPVLVGGLPSTPELGALVLRDHLVYLPGASYEYSMVARCPEADAVCRSGGAICARLTIEVGEQRIRGLRRQTDEVEAAHRRGLLDDYGHSRARFKLQIKPTVRKLDALRTSGYLPEREWGVDVVFGQWVVDDTGDVILSPCPDDAAPHDVEIQFRAVSGGSDFRMTDLFEGLPDS